MTTVEIRAATPADAEALLAIYRPIVTATAVSFEVEPPTVDEFAARIEQALRAYAWLVAVVDGRPVGYAYGTSHRARAAYRYSVETAIYVGASNRGCGIGRDLYRRLFERLVERGCYHAFAGIVLPNDASLALHQAVGFEPIGVFPRVGFKFGAWHDVSWWSRQLQGGVPLEPGR